MGGHSVTATPTPIMGELSTCGVHNANLEASTIRIIEGASWKRQDTVIILPAGKTVPTKAAMSWMHLMTPPNQRAPRISMIGMEVGDAYSAAIDQILAHPDLKTCQYVLCIEHDNVCQPDSLIKLLKSMDQHPELAAIGGLYWTKGEGGVPQIWGDVRDPILNFRPQPPDPKGGVVECCGVAQGFTLFRMSMFEDKRLSRPLFRTKASLAEGCGTQDLALWADARKYGYRCGVDCSVLIGHLDNESGIVW